MQNSKSQREQDGASWLHSDFVEMAPLRLFGGATSRQSRDEKANYIFISDLHIKPDDEYKQKRFGEFLTALSTDVRLFLVGDIFDYWVPNSEKRYAKLLSLLHDFTRTHDVCFVEGNRDFLAKDYLKKIGVSIMPRSYSFKISSKTIFVTHGDILFSSDSLHCIYSSIIRSDIVTSCKSYVSERLSETIGTTLRKVSRGNYENKQLPPHEVISRFLIYNDIVIAGHFHFNRILEYNHKGFSKYMVFLGEQTDRELQYLHLCCSIGGLELKLNSF